MRQKAMSRCMTRRAQAAYQRHGRYAQAARVTKCCVAISPVRDGKTQSPYTRQASSAAVPMPQSGSSASSSSAIRQRTPQPDNCPDHDSILFFFFFSFFSGILVEWRSDEAIERQNVREAVTASCRISLARAAIYAEAFRRVYSSSEIRVTLSRNPRCCN